LVAHLEKIDGTLVCRGTPVEKHWAREYYNSDTIE
jgi:hypothetical protein